MRHLTSSEVAWAKASGAKRFYLPSLGGESRDEFFRLYDEFWAEVVRTFDEHDRFWSNAISSKFQNWECSFSYLALVLFTLHDLQSRSAESVSIVIVCGSTQEEGVCGQWARLHGWDYEVKRASSIGSFVRRCRQRVRALAASVRCFLGALRKKWYCPTPRFEDAGDKPARVTIVASQFYGRNIMGGRWQDPCFGPLSDFLANRGHHVVTVAWPLEKLNSQTRAEMSSLSESRVYAVHALLGWWDFCVAFISLLFQPVRVNGAKFHGCEFGDLINWQGFSVLAPFNLMAALYGRAITVLGAQFRPNRLVCIFEGNVAERSCIQRFRQFNSGPVVGYSQGVLYALNLKLRRCPSEIHRPDPELFVSTGPRGKRLFDRLTLRDGSKTKTGCAMRPLSKSGGFASRGRKILLALDGVWSSAYLLSWFVEHCERLEGESVLVRSHPNVPLDRLLRQIVAPWPEQFEISSRTLDEDLDASYCVLYRSTSVGLQALMNGVPAVHLNIDSPLPSDPLGDDTMGKWVVSSVGELLDALGQIRALDEGFRQDLLNESGSCAEQYFAEPTDEAMESFAQS